MLPPPGACIHRLKVHGLLGTMGGKPLLKIGVALEEEIPYTISITIKKGTAMTNLFCVDCGCEIPLERSDAIPGVEFCVKCAGKIDHQRAFAKGSPGETLFNEMMDMEEVDTSTRQEAPAHPQLAT